jgi:hypothetical protein
MFVGALVQFNSEENLIATNLRYRWEYAPGSELYAIYNEGRDTLARGFPSMSHRVFVVKLAQLLRF